MARGPVVDPEMVARKVAAMSLGRAGAGGTGRRQRLDTRWA
jgi:hypothetical protein